MMSNIEIRLVETDEDWFELAEVYYNVNTGNPYSYGSIDGFFDEDKEGYKKAVMKAFELPVMYPSSFEEKD